MDGEHPAPPALGCAGGLRPAATPARHARVALAQPPPRARPLAAPALPGPAAWFPPLRLPPPPVPADDNPIKCFAVSFSDTLVRSFIGTEFILPGRAAMFMYVMLKGAHIGHKVISCCKFKVQALRSLVMHAIACAAHLPLNVAPLAFDPCQVSLRCAAR